MAKHDGDSDWENLFRAKLLPYYPNARPTLYACTVYWYLAPGGDDPYAPVDLPGRAGYYVEPAPRQKPGALEGERLKILSCTGGNPQLQDMTGFGDSWSNDAHLWWIQAKPGDKLVLAVPVEKAGRYQLWAQLTKAVDYGIVRLSLDDTPLSGPVDLFNNGVIATGELDLGIHELAAGEHRLTVEITGANDKAVKSYMFGLDYLRLQPVP